MSLLRKISSYIILLTLLASFNPIKAQKIVFYLHGRIIENQGPNAIDSVNGFGEYKYYDILDSLRKNNFIVLSETREANTLVKDYAHKIVKQIDSLLKKGIVSKNITVIGASKGAFIAMYVSTYLKNSNVNFVLMAACSEDILETNPELMLHGNILSIYEKSDSLFAQSCIQLKNNSKHINHYKEIEINTGLRHGFLYKPLSQWLEPSVKWANNNYN